jgi:hypothetical protein
MSADRAVKITDKSLDLIESLHGVRPKTQSRTTYYVSAGDPEQYDLIMTKKKFDNTFKFTDAESEDQFSEVTEL